jgi:hypothetical protein
VSTPRPNARPRPGPISSAPRQRPCWPVTSSRRSP